MSEVSGTKIDEAFIGSCMTHIGQFRAAAKVLGNTRDILVKLWVAPPTKMDESELIKKGHYATFGSAGARPKCPAARCAWATRPRCARVPRSCRRQPATSPTVCLGKNTKVFLGPAELAAVCSKLGRIPTVAGYMEAVDPSSQRRRAGRQHFSFAANTPCSSPKRRGASVGYL
jgi:aconitate hydratase 2/2-methylisocitrate dehydratase